MTERTHLSRRTFLASATTAAALAARPRPGHATARDQAPTPATGAPQPRMRTRPIPATGEPLPVIGLGSTKVVDEIETHGIEPVGQVLRTMTRYGGSLIDTWPLWMANVANNVEFGRVIDEPDLREALFLVSKLDVSPRSGTQGGKEAGLIQFRAGKRLFHRKQLDLLQVMNLSDIATHWPTAKELKAAGEVRYIGATIATGPQLHQSMEQFARENRPDFVALGYSIVRREAEERLLPILGDLGVAVLINSPLMGGAYFRYLAGKALPEWAKEVGIESWAQFALKYLLANPHVTCLLTETSNPRNMEDNARAGLGELPDADTLRRMREFIDAIVV